MGSERVGKTSILSQFLYDQFISEYRYIHLKNWRHFTSVGLNAEIDLDSTL